MGKIPQEHLLLLYHPNKEKIGQRKVDVVDLMLVGRIFCFTAPERTIGASCGQGGIRTPDTVVRSHVL